MGSKLTRESMAAKESNKALPGKEVNDEQYNKKPKKTTLQRILERLQIRSNKTKKWQMKVNKDKKTLSPPLKNPAKRMQPQSSEREEDTKESEWTEVSLQTAESPPKHAAEYERKIIPVPPPRKHKAKLEEILDGPQLIKELAEHHAPVPVEEALIVPKKVIEHVCDGTHHHVRNVINGTVVDQIIPLEHSNEVKQNKSAAEHASTLSLPSYNDLKKKDDKRVSSHSKTTEKKSSASSLPTDKKAKTSHSAAEKIESYMIRCKSFGSIIPHTKSEKSKRAEPDSDKESIDSWSGLEDWDLGIIEHDVSTDFPQTPLKSNTNYTIAQVNNNSALKQKAERNKLDTAGIDLLLASIGDETPAKRISQTMHDIVKESTCKQDEARTPNNGSYPFKNVYRKGVFENDAFFTTEFIRHESDQCSSFQDSSQLKIAPLAGFDSDKESDKDANVSEVLNGENGITLELKEQPSAESEKTKEDRTQKKTVLSNTQRSIPCVIPRRKSSSGHSKLLKFIKDTNENGTSKNILKMKTQDKNGEVIKETNEKDYKMEEPKIVPEIKSVDVSWHNLIKRDDVNNLPLLEQESSISDLIETSSDETRSTTIETCHK